jgi:TRAP-type mannitol/chloroaromatic compound transport system substrate-binding protein
MSLDDIFERKLREARERGDFKDEVGRGALDIGDWDGLPDDERLAMQLMRQNGYAPAWIEEDKSLRGKLSETRQFLAKAFARYRQRLRKAEDAVARIAADDEWKRARVQFEERVTEFNREIFLFNLRAPSLVLQRLPMRASEEYEALGISISGPMTAQ